MDQANVSWIAPLSHDDAWHPDHLATLLAAARESHAEWIYSRMEMVDVSAPGEPRLRSCGAWPPRMGEFAEIEDFVDVDALDPALFELEFAVPQTTPSLRRDATADARRRGFTRAATLIDPVAAVASTAALGTGCYVAPGEVVVGNPARVLRRV
jgi:hypothetical protein